MALVQAVAPFGFRRELLLERPGGSGSWDTTSLNWNGVLYQTGIANALGNDPSVGSFAIFSNLSVGSSPITVTLNTPAVNAGVQVWGGTVNFAAGSSPTLNMNNGTGILDYGGTQSTYASGITWQVNTGAQNWTNNSSSPLTFSSGTIINSAFTSATTLTLNGSGIGGINIAGVIQNNAQTLTVNENMTGGAVTLSGLNTYTGGNNLQGGTLNINLSGNGSASPLGTGEFVMTNTPTIDNTSGSAVTVGTGNAITLPGAMAFGGTGSLNLGAGIATSGGTALTLNGNHATPSVLTLQNLAMSSAGKTFAVNYNPGANSALSVGSLNLTAAAGGTTTINGSAPVSVTGSLSGGATAGLTYAGANTLTLSGNSGSYTGTITANSGTIVVNAATSSAVLGSSPLTFGGGAFTFNGTGTTQPISNVTVNAGGGVLTVGGTGSNTLNMGTLAPAATANGATLSIKQGANATITTTSAPLASPDGTYGARVTFTDSSGNTNWATGTLTAGVYPLVGFNSYNTGFNGSTDVANNNYSISGGQVFNNDAVNSLKIAPLTPGSSLTIPSSTTLTLTNGGLLFTGNLSFQISGAGSLKSGVATNSDLIVQNFSSQTLTIGAVIANGNGARR